MKKIVVMLLIGIQLVALDFNNATDIQIRSGIAYESFKQNPFTGVGKIKIDKGKECKIIIATFKNGLLKGAMEQWSCNGNLLSKGTRIGKKDVGHFESWDIENGNKYSDIYYDSQGKIKSGWIKRKFIDEYDLYPNELDKCFSENMIYKNGKMTGYKMYTKHNCIDKGKVTYYKESEFIGCKACK